MVLAARGDGQRFSLSVAVPPGGTVLGVWVDGHDGWLNRAKEGCREVLPRGVLPLSAKASLPLDPELAALLLSGLLPAGARELTPETGWVEAPAADLRWRARVEGPQPHCTRIVLNKPSSDKPLLDATMSDPHGHVPGKLVLKAGSVDAELVLQAWQPSDPPAAPAWLSAPVCGGRP